ncbi:MAG: hypothetical protein EHM61_20285 [Acidobacteria bacterium]|nr:MAG: hypothetical protein EHM61_20285 [Acidobacteriota bacterium]
MGCPLSTIEPFNTLPSEITSELAARSLAIELPAERVLFHQGDPGDCLYIVLEGAVSVYSESEDGGRRQLTLLERGAVFGEMALLTGQPRSASVRTTTDVRLMGIRKTEFDRVVTAHPELVVALARTLSKHLNRVTADLSRAEASEKAYQRLLSEYYAGPQVPLVGRTKAITEVIAEAERLAGCSEPVLIGGAPGTEKRSVAWRIHQAGDKSSGPFVIFDPHQVHLGDASKVESTGGIASELAQDATLFGCPPGIIPSIKSGRMGLLQAADGGTLVIENIDSLQPAVQEKLAGYLETGTFPLADGQRRRSTARIIGLLSKDTGSSRPNLSERLLSEGFSKNRISVPTLARRKKDLALILDALVESLSKRLGKRITGVEQEAYQAVLAYDWPGNVEELDIVVRRAIKLTESEQIRAQDIFVGADEQGGPAVELLKQPEVKSLFLSRYFPSACQLLTGLALSAVVLFTIAGFWSTGTDLALVAVWGIGEPLFLISTLVVARLGCSFCPFGRLSSILSSTGLRRDPPNWLRRRGPYLAALGLGIILWAEVVTGMPHSPGPTVVLILSILLLAALAGLVFKRRTWCRFLCPLGNWVGSLATCSALELRGRTAVCNSDCASHVCYRGEPGQSGCPMFEGPFSLSENTDCILCADCIKVCPNNSPLVNLRLPAQELWKNRRLSAALPAFVPVMVATQLLRLSDHSGLLDPLRSLDASALILAGLTVLLWAGTLALAKGLSMIAARSTEHESTATEVVRPSTWLTSGASLLVGIAPLVVACELAYQFGALLGRGPEALGILDRLAGWDQLSGIVFLPWQVKAVELIVLSAGMGMTLIVERKLPKPRLRTPGIVGSMFLYLLFVGLVLLA